VISITPSGDARLATFEQQLIARTYPVLHRAIVTLLHAAGLLSATHGPMGLTASKIPTGTNTNQTVLPDRHREAIRRAV